MARLFDNVQNKRKPTYVDVGGQGDCGFRAVAASIVDIFLLAHPPVEPKLLENLLQHYFNYFPQYRDNALMMNAKPADCMQLLIKQMQGKMNELLQTLAYTLRQMAVDEMCKYPARYRGAFVDKHEQTSPEHMRQPTVWIDENAMAALSHALKIPIEVKVVERSKVVPMRLCYGANYEESRVPVPKVVVRLQHCHYTPRVTLIDQFKSMQSAPQRFIQPAVASKQADPSVSEILSAIAEEDKKILKTFQQVHNRLVAMLNASEITADDLLACYVKGMTNSDYLCGRIKYACLEQGSQKFFDAISHTQQSHQYKMQPINLKLDDLQITAEVIHSLARAISVEQFSLDDVFAHIEERCEQGARGSRSIADDSEFRPSIRGIEVA